MKFTTHIIPMPLIAALDAPGRCPEPAEADALSLPKVMLLKGDTSHDGHSMETAV